MKLKSTIIAALLVVFALPAVAVADGYYYEDEELEAYDDIAWSYDDAEWSPQTLNAYDGVYWYGDRLETYYSSNVAYHYRTSEWWIDDEGFYRTDEGYYVVAASDYDEGAIIEGSKGLCQVLDCGCDDGVTDYYVNW